MKAVAMTQLDPAPLDVANLPPIDYAHLGFEVRNADGEYLEFHAVADPIHGWNVLATCSTETMLEICAIMRERAGVRA